jgi:hypothetical protein
MRSLVVNISDVRESEAMNSSLSLEKLGSRGTKTPPAFIIAKIATTISGELRIYTPTCAPG